MLPLSRARLFTTYLYIHLTLLVLSFLARLLPLGKFWKKADFLRKKPEILINLAEKIKILPKNFKAIFRRSRRPKKNQNFCLSASKKKIFSQKLKQIRLKIYFHFFPNLPQKFRSFFKKNPIFLKIFHFLFSIKISNFSTFFQFFTKKIIKILF